MKNKIHELYALEQLAGGNTCIHRLNPAVKLLAAVVFIITVISFDRYSFGRLVPYIFYPTVLMALSETPYAMLLKRFLIALPFCFFAGAANVVFDRNPAFAAGGIDVSYGVVSLFTVLFRVYLCVMSVLILVSVTPLSQIVHAMRRLRIPHVFIIVFEMTYRYIGVLLEEVYSMYTAYSLRSSNAKGIQMRDMGSFTGQLLVRSFDRADRVYNAMKCRGYALQNNVQETGKITGNDIIFFTVTCILCLAFRLINVNVLFAGIIGGII
ncbi:MAG: cobalt ECF transporter T component CbiQ [Treponema sp.]|nr:cobalt ECF transporter T component CbiQ [Treponema sp.]